VPWQQLTLRIAATDLAEAEALLGLAGASAISISDAADSPILEPGPGTTPLWPRLALRALFDSGADLRAVAGLLGSLADTGTSLEIIEDAAVERALLQTIRPLDIGPRLRLAAADDPAAGDARTLMLNMGLAFGTGQHPTTRLCLTWLEREPPAGLSVLDFGCGTGVLALAALKLGARHALAVDIEPQALEATRRNAALNALETSVRTGPPDCLGNDCFDLILANILAEPLIELAPVLAARQPSGGRIVLCGILQAQSEPVAEVYRQWYEALTATELDGWVLLTGCRRSGYDR
jgi:ribosomal protein L11 methyltransferase